MHTHAHKTHAANAGGERVERERQLNGEPQKRGGKVTNKCVTFICDYESDIMPEILHRTRIPNNQ